MILMLGLFTSAIASVIHDIRLHTCQTIRVSRPTHQGIGYWLITFQIELDDRLALYQNIDRNEARTTLMIFGHVRQNLNASHACC